MADMYVAVEALNLRSSPNKTNDNVIGSLFLTQKIDVTAEATDGWVQCTASVDGAQKIGFVSGSFLRRPTTPNREALIASVHAQYMRFNHGMGKEHIQPFAGFVGEMWKAIHINNLDGTHRDQPWSAAAISFMVRHASAAYAGFRFEAAHSKFIHHAIKCREANDATAPFWGFRLDEARPEIGDIVARDNPDHGPVVTFDVAAAMDSYRSHSDIVVQIDSAKQRLLAIGGNVSNSVSITVYDLAPGDFLADTKNTFALLKNRTDS
jgi:hypothetical protein